MTSTRDRIVDVTCVTLAGLVAVLAAMGAYEAGAVPRPYLLVAGLITAAGCAALWWRRRWPVGVAVLLIAISVVTDMVGGALLVAVFTVAVRRRTRVAVGVAALSLVAGIPYSIRYPDPDLPATAVNVVGVALWSIVVFWGIRIRTRRETLAALRERAARAEAEAALETERVRGLERERIAREMHDVLAHRISLVSLHAGALEVRPDLSRDEVARAAGTIRASAHQALEDLREILGVLRAGPNGATPDGGVLRPQPDLDAVDGLVAESRAAGATVTVVAEAPDRAALPASVSRTAFRVVQEGLTNARKHAPGQEVHVLLAGAPGGALHVRIRNGLAAGAVVIPGSRSGLIGLAERVSLLGGRVEHGVRRDVDGAIGFVLEAWLPWPT
jgi:signal transduction histidine kinase